MKELRIEEQMNIFGGKEYWYTDYTRNLEVHGTDRKKLLSEIDYRRNVLGHKVSGLRY